MTLWFLKEHIKKSFIDNKEKILKALTTQNWNIVDYISFRNAVYLKSDKGYWLSNINSELFPREILIEEILNLNKQLNKN